MAEPRSICQVPGCHNSSAKFHPHEYLCSRHWKDVPRWMRRRDRALIRLLKARGKVVEGPNGYQCKGLRSRTLLWNSWRGMVKAAVRRNMGL